MRLLTVVLVIAGALHSCTKVTGTVVTRNDDLGELQAELQRADSDIFRHKEQWGTYTPNSDCFRDRIAAIRSHCSDVESRPLEVAKAAVSLTQCDVEDAGLPLAPQCSTIKDERSLQACLRTLEHSSQHWTSYHLHKQQIVPLCYAYKRVHDIDEAKRIYAAITQEKRALLEALAKLIESTSLHESEMRDIARGIAQVTSDTQATVPALLLDLKRQQEVAARALETMESKAVTSHETLQSAASRLVGEVSEAQGHTAGQVAVQTRQQLDELYALARDQHQSLLANHQTALNDVARHVKGLLIDETLALQIAVQQTVKHDQISEAHVNALAQVSADLRSVLQREANELVTAGKGQALVVRELQSLALAARGALGNFELLLNRSAIAAEAHPSTSAADIVRMFWRLVENGPSANAFTTWLRLGELAHVLAKYGLHAFLGFLRLTIALWCCLLALGTTLFRTLLKRIYRKRFARGMRVWVGVQDQHSEEVQMVCVLSHDQDRKQHLTYDEEMLACSRVTEVKDVSSVYPSLPKCSTQQRQTRLASDGRGVLRLARK